MLIATSNFKALCPLIHTHSHTKKLKAKQQGEEGGCAFEGGNKMPWILLWDSFFYQPANQYDSLAFAAAATELCWHSEDREETYNTAVALLYVPEFNEVQANRFISQAVLTDNRRGRIYIHIKLKGTQLQSKHTDALGLIKCFSSLSLVWACWDVFTCSETQKFSKDFKSNFSPNPEN